MPAKPQTDANTAISFHSSPVSSPLHPPGEFPARPRASCAVGQVGRAISMPSVVAVIGQSGSRVAGPCVFGKCLRRPRQHLAQVLAQFLFIHHARGWRPGCCARAPARAPPRPRVIPPSGGPGRRADRSMGSFFMGWKLARFPARAREMPDPALFFRPCVPAGPSIATGLTRLPPAPWWPFYLFRPPSDEHRANQGARGCTVPG